jgi:nucleoside 2-deoxyribosyltransferase
LINIYLAGHLHTNWRDDLIDSVNQSLSMYAKTDNIHWLIPKRSIDTPFGKPGNDKRFYVPNDIQMINRADIIVYSLEKDHGNIGGAWEVGYAFAKNKPVYLLDQDPDNYRYDILRATSFVFTTHDEIIEAIMMAGMTA